jgi:hypothetical protein
MIIIFKVKTVVNVEILQKNLMVPDAKKYKAEGGNQEGLKPLRDKIAGKTALQSI